jgi:hypothetical protein
VVLVACLDQLHLQQILEDYSDLIQPLRLIPQVASLVNQNQHSKILVGDCLERHNSQMLHHLLVDYLGQTQLQEAAYLDRHLNLQLVFLDNSLHPTKELQEDYLDSQLHNNQACLDKHQPFNQHLVEDSLDNHNNQVYLVSKLLQDKLQRGQPKAE